MVDHAVILRGASFTGAVDAPVILQRTDQEFIPAILEALASQRGREAIAESVASTRDDNHLLKLFQPVHRTFHVALLEVVCDTFGQPRLDPQRIDSAGLVLRRVAVDQQGQELELLLFRHRVLS